MGSETNSRISGWLLDALLNYNFIWQKGWSLKTGCWNWRPGSEELHKFVFPARQKADTAVNDCVWQKVDNCQLLQAQAQTSDFWIHAWLSSHAPMQEIKWWVTITCAWVRGDIEREAQEREGKGKKKKKKTYKKWSRRQPAERQALFGLLFHSVPWLGSPLTL